jgi:pimeloyl-ACP methyl ester carboxylesterase
VIRGNRDQWLDRDVASRLAAEIPGARLENVVEAARLIPEDSPDRLTELLLDFAAESDAISGARFGASTIK